MPRKHRPLDRDSGVVRDANLIVIASEDTYAVKEYFERFRTRRVQVIVAPTEDSCSSPQHVMNRLERCFQDYSTADGDTFWLCIDRDRWPEPQLNDICRECSRKGYQVSLSAPCFELWLLLHFEPVTAPLSCEEAKQRLRQALGGYGKRCCQQMALTEQSVKGAVDRARAMDGTIELVPSAPVTRVYKILETLLEKDLINFV